MAIFDRNKGVPGAKPNLWIRYTITEALRVQHGLNSRKAREPVPENNKRVAAALEAQRKREIRDGTWAPASKGGGSQGLTLRQYGDAWLVKRETAGVKSVRNERQRLRDHVYPTLGDRRLADIRRKDVVDLIAAYAQTPSEETGKLPAPRTVHRVYEDVRTLFAQAFEVDEIIPMTPCSLKVRRGELPKKRDADPRWRATAVFTREEVQDLISDERIELPRRVTYALMYLTGARIGEVSGLLWRDFDATLKPLGRLIVATTYDGEETKTETPRLVPVHPVLAEVLGHWKAEGYALWACRRPKADDHIVPRLRNNGTGRHPDEEPFIVAKTVHRHLQKDLKAIGYRGRRVHDSRRTFISLARADGARKDILDWITHGPRSSDMQDLYTTLPWETFCEQVSCLRIARQTQATVIPIRAVSATREL
jgi:integrase